MAAKEYYQGETFEGFDPGETLNSVEYSDCVFRNCRWTGTRVQNCSFIGCTFVHCNFSAVVFSFCLMRDAWLQNSAFRMMAWGGLTGRSKLAQPFGKIEGCAFQYNDFSGMSLNGFDFSGSTFAECRFDDCHLAGACFHGVPLGRSSFTRCDLERADFRDARAYAIDPSDNKLKDARFSFPDVVALLDSIGIRIE